MKYNYDIAILMEVDPKKEFTLFFPVSVVRGNFHDDTGYFETIDGSSFCSLPNFILDFDSEQGYICSDIISGEDFYNDYLKGRSFKDAIELYKEKNAKTKIVYYCEQYDASRCIDFDVTMLNDFDRVGSNNSIINNSEDQICFDFSLDAINKKENDLVQLIELQKENQEFLNEAWVYLDKTAESCTNVMKQIVGIRKEGLGVVEEPIVVPKKEEKSAKVFDRQSYYERRKRIIKEVKDVIKGHDKEVEEFVIEIFRLRRKYGKKNRGILLTGSTGVGKTKMCELISEKLDVPCKIIDTTQLTMPGYKGKDIEDFLEQLYDDCDGDLNKVENSIIVFNEIDKKGSTSNYDVSGKGVLNQLLSFLDGCEYTIKDSQFNKVFQKKRIKTNNMVVIFAGSFSSIYQNPKFKRQSIGFENSNNDINREPTIEDYVSLGGMPDESIGRFPVIIHLSDLTKKDLKDILVNSYESPLKFAIMEFKGEASVDLQFTQEAIDLIVDIAYKEKTGARSLNKIIENVTSVAFQEVTDNFGEYDKVIITDATVLDNKKFDVERKQKQKKLLLMKKNV